MEVIKRKIIANTDYFDFNIESHIKKKDFDNTFNFLMTDLEYNSIFDYLLYIYLMNYMKKNIPIDQLNQINRYHVNFGAFMVFNFLIEFELFTLFHSIFPYNTTERPSENTFPAIFNQTDLSFKYRVYKDDVDKSFIEKLDLFTKTLDDLFVKFMNILIGKIRRSFDIDD